MLNELYGDNKWVEMAFEIRSDTLKPILFNTEMVKAILDGRKTVTRRVVKPQPDEKHIFKLGYVTDEIPRCGNIGKFGFGIDECGGHIQYAKPPYKIGDVLWVRETWHKDVGRYMYKANYSESEKFYRGGQEIDIKWCPSIHMPKEAARIFLKVTDVRVERLQDITEEQAIKEGCNASCKSWGDSKFEDVIEFEQSARDMFSELWNGTLKKDSDCTWMHNPLVWVIEFERISKEDCNEREFI